MAPSRDEEETSTGERKRVFFSIALLFKVETLFALTCHYYVNVDRCHSGDASYCNLLKLSDGVYGRADNATITPWWENNEYKKEKRREDRKYKRDISKYSLLRDEHPVSVWWRCQQPSYTFICGFIWTHLNVFAEVFLSDLEIHVNSHLIGTVRTDKAPPP